MRNLSRISNYWNRVEAWRDWNTEVKHAIANNVPYGDIAPVEGETSWRKIDKALAKLRARIAEHKGVTL